MHFIILAYVCIGKSLRKKSCKLCCWTISKLLCSQSRWAINWGKILSLTVLLSLLFMCTVKTPLWVWVVFQFRRQFMLFLKIFFSFRSNLRWLWNFYSKYYFIFKSLIGKAKELTRLLYQSKLLWIIFVSLRCIWWLINYGAASWADVLL